MLHSSSGSRTTQQTTAISYADDWTTPTRATHPSIERTSRRPDFRVSHGDSTFLLEATTVTAITTERRHRDRRLKTLTEAIDKAVADAFCVRLQILVEGDDQPPAGPVVRELERWLGTSTPTRWPSCYAATSPWRRCRRTTSARATGCSASRRFPSMTTGAAKLTGPMIVLIHIETSHSDPTAGVRRALERKGARYIARHRPPGGPRQRARR
jgi:hypothetical protein